MKYKHEQNSPIICVSKDNTDYMECVGNCYPRDCHGMSHDLINMVFNVYTDVVTSEKRLVVRAKKII